MEAKQKPFAKLRAFWKGMSRSLRIALIALVIVVLILIVMLVLNASKAEYELLYYGMEPKDAAEVYALLQDMGVPYRLEGSNRINILIPAGQRGELILKLQNAGYPATDSDLYSYFDSGLGIGATEFDKQVAYQQQLEQRIAYSVKQMNKVKSAVVMVSMGKQSGYALSAARNVPAQASVMLALKDDIPLSPAEAEAVRSLVTQAVSMLTPENITIADTSMRIYNIPDASNTSGYAGDQIELKRKAQDLIENQVTALLSPVFNRDYITVSANVDLDFDKRSTQSVTYSPPGDADNMGIIAALRQTAERLGTGQDAGGVVGFDPNGAAPFYPEGLDAAQGDAFRYTQEINAELNEVREQVDQQMGKWKSVRVSVMFHADEKWDAELTNLQGIIANAVGVETQYVSLMRTDFKTITDLEAAAKAAANQPAPEAEFPIMLVAIAAGALLLFALILFFITSRAKKRRKALEAELARLAEEQRLLVAAETMDEQRDDLSSALQEDDPVKIRLGEIQGLADERPEVVAQLLRNWLTDDFGR